MSRPEPRRTRIRLLIVEDHVMLREALALTLSADPSLEVVSHCATVAEAMSSIARHDIDVVVLDRNLRFELGDELLPLARAAGFSGRFVLISGALSTADAARLRHAGVSAIFDKAHSLPELISLIYDSSSQPPAAPTVELPDDAAPVAPPGGRPFTASEFRVLLSVCEGLSTRQISESLQLSEGSVKSFVQQLFLKTGVRSRAQLVRIAIEQGWLALPVPGTPSS